MVGCSGSLGGVECFVHGSPVVVWFDAGIASGRKWAPAHPLPKTRNYNIHKQRCLRSVLKYCIKVTER